MLTACCQPLPSRPPPGEYHGNLINREGGERSSQSAVGSMDQLAKLQPSGLLAAACKAVAEGAMVPTSRMVQAANGRAVLVTMERFYWDVIDEISSADGIDAKTLCRRAQMRYPGVPVTRAITAYLGQLILSRSRRAGYPRPSRRQTPPLTGPR